MDANAIFDNVIKAGKLIIIKNQYNEKAAQIKSCQAKRCGNCGHWMKNSCTPEKKFNQFKSIDSTACKDFVLSYNSESFIKEFTKELQLIKKKIAVVV